MSAAAGKWPMVPLGEVAEIVSGATPKSGVEEFWGGDIQWATPADLSSLQGAYIESTARQISQAGKHSCGTHILPSGSVLLSSRAPIGLVAVNKVPMATNQGFKSIVPGSSVHYKYLYHWLSANTKVLQSMGNGATFKEISKKSVSRLHIPLPPLDEQRRIAAILDKADSFVAGVRRSAEELHDVSGGVFRRMFSGGEVRMARLGDLVSLKSGSTPSKSEPENWSGSQAWFSAKDFKSSDLFNSKDRISEHLVTSGKVQTVPRDTVAVVVRGMILAHTFPVSVFRVEATFNQDVKAIVPDGCMNSDFLAAALRSRSRWILNRVAASAHGTRRLETDVLLSAPVPVASIERQEEFGKVVSAVRTQQGRLDSMLARATELRGSLQSRAFRGEL
jgi:type I restriction enzyme S subunit